MNADLKKTVQSALLEDLPQGDLTTDPLHIEENVGRARLIAKEDLVLSGSQLFTITFHELDPAIKLQWQFKDGDFVLKGQTICTLKGSLAALLKGERVALNFLGHLSGIATLTRCFVKAVEKTATKILDTRKTTPGLRSLEKEAVRHGGGHNHRMNLSDAVLIKENHIRAAGSIKNAMGLIRTHTTLPIEVEVRNLDEVRQALDAKADRLLLDNMSNDTISETMKIVPYGVQIEASGNMTLDRVADVAELGVHFISVGAITHSAPCADVSLLFD